MRYAAEMFLLGRVRVMVSKPVESKLFDDRVQAFPLFSWSSYFPQLMGSKLADQAMSQMALQLISRIAKPS